MRNYSRLIVTLIVLMYVVDGLSQNLNPSYDYSSVREIRIIEDDLLHFDTSRIRIADPYHDIPQISGGELQYTTVNEVNASITYSLDSLSEKVDSFWNLEVYFLIIGESTDSVYVDDTLRIFHDTTESKYRDVYTLLIDSTVMDTSFEFLITDLHEQTMGGNELPRDIIAELQFGSRRKDRLSQTLPPVLESTSLNGCEMITWSFVHGSEFYEIDYAFIDELDQNPPVDPFTRKIRVETDMPEYTISLTYPQGTLYVRVRAVGIVLDQFSQEERYVYGPWSQTRQILQSTDFEEDINWNVKKSFAEGGKKKETAMYYDDAFKSRQTVVSLNTEKKYLISETYYDAEGREALKIIPTPDLDTDAKLTFRTNYNKSEGGEPYGYENFEKNMADPVSLIEGSGKYYSGNNNSSQVNKDFIPDAEGYPLIHTKYVRDNSGRIASQGGVKPEFQNSVGHETKYIYATPSNTELRRLFGAEIGEPSHYKKIITVDANGQNSIVYKDIYGNIVATALEGVNNVASGSRTQSLPSSTRTQVNSLITGEKDDNYIICSYNTIYHPGASPNQPQTFMYRLNEEMIQVDQDICLKCLYRLEVWVEDECGDRVLLGTPSFPSGSHPFSFNDLHDIVTVYFGTQPLGSYDCTPQFDEYAVDFRFYVNSTPGAYTIVKKLSLVDQDEEVLVDLAQTNIDYSQISEIIKSLIDEYSCIENCDDLCDLFVTETIEASPMYNETHREMLTELCQTELCERILNDLTSQGLDENCSNYQRRMKDQLGPSRPGSFTSWSDFKVLLSSDDCHRNVNSVLHIRDKEGVNWKCYTDPTLGEPVFEDEDGTLTDSPIEVQCEGMTVTITPVNGVEFSWSDIEDNLLGKAACWQIPWGDDLVDCHREYCIVSHCENWLNATSFNYDLGRLDSWEDANQEFCSGNCNSSGTSNNAIANDIQLLIDGIMLIDFQNNFTSIPTCSTSVEELVNEYIDNLHLDYQAKVNTQVANLNLTNPNLSQLTEYITLYIVQNRKRQDRDAWLGVLISLYNQIKEEAFWDCLDGDCPSDSGDDHILFERPELFEERSIQGFLSIVDNKVKQHQDGYCDEKANYWASIYSEQFGQPPLLAFSELLVMLCEEICIPTTRAGCYSELECPIDNPELVDYCDSEDIVTIESQSGGTFNDAAEILYHKESVELEELNKAYPPFMQNNPYIPDNITHQFVFAFKSQDHLTPSRQGMNSWSQRVRVHAIPDMCGVDEGGIGGPGLPEYLENLRLAVYLVDCEYHPGQGSYVPQFNNACANKVRRINSEIYYNYYGGISAEWDHTAGNGQSGDCSEQTYILHFYKTEYEPEGLESRFVFEINSDFRMNYSLVQTTENFVKKSALTAIYHNIPNQGEAEKYLKSIWNCESVCKSIENECLINVLETMETAALTCERGTILWSREPCPESYGSEYEIGPPGQTGTPDEDRFYWFTFGGTTYHVVNEYGSVVYFCSTEILDWASTEVPPEWIYSENSVISDNEFTGVKLLLRTTANVNTLHEGGQEPYCTVENEDFIHVGYLLASHKPEGIEDFVVDINCNPDISSESDCDEELQLLISEEIDRLYSERINEEIDKIKSKYDDCWDEESEEMYIEMDQRDYHYTLYYYDQANNLVKTVPPRAVRPLDDSKFTNGKLNDPTEVPNHVPELVTTYNYNSFNNVISQVTPDAGLTTFYYDNEQRLRLTQDAEQESPTVPGEQERSTYSKYDRLNRVRETGTTVYVPDASLEDLLEDPDFPDGSSGQERSDFNQFFYDAPLTSIPSSIPIEQNNTRGRLAYSEYRPDDNVDDVLEMAYSYDAHGNVDQYATYQSEVGWKYMTYDYDLISGNVHQFNYQPSNSDQFYTKYLYDEDNRLERVYTSKNGWAWDEDARYFYYMHGPLARMELGNEKVQGLDYMYTVQGWIKSVNLPGDNSYAFEPGEDGNNGSGFTENLNLFIGRDAMSYSLGYYEENDYLPIGSGVFLGSMTNAWDNNQLGGSILPTGTLSNGLYNGNIVWMISDLKNLNVPQNAMTYQYDQLHRLKRAKSYYRELGAWQAHPNMQSFNLNVDYDKNGNITELTRVGLSGEMDELTYDYNLFGIDNKLDNINDDVNSGLYHHDFDDDQTLEYDYDNRGNLTEDNNVGISWYDFGKVRKVTNFPDEIEYQYDPSGNRAVKSVENQGSVLNTIYIRDPSGNIVSVYDEQNGLINQVELPIYGSSRLGTYGHRKEVVAEPGVDRELYRSRKRYELTNHLGNVMATVTDRRLTQHDPNGYLYSVAEVVSTQDYYPFGLEMRGSAEITKANPESGRAYRNPRFIDESYRYGFNGKERDDDFHEDVTNYDYGFRIYNPGIARFLSTDPKSRSYPMLSPYNYAGNMPVQAIDRDGKDFIIITWHSKPGDQGHTALAIENYKTVIENGVEKNVKDGTYTVYEVYPAAGTGNIESYVNEIDRTVTGQVSSRVVNSLEDLKSITFGPDNRKASGLVQFTSDADADLAAQQVLNSDVTEMKTIYSRDTENPFILNEGTEFTNPVIYSLIESADNNNCTFNCASFAIKQASLLYGISQGEPENIKTSGGTIRTDLFGGSANVPSLDVDAYTPNQVFKTASKQGTVIKGAGNNANTQDFIYQVTGTQLKDETPGK